MPVAYARVSEANTFGKSEQLPHHTARAAVKGHKTTERQMCICAALRPGPTASNCQRGEEACMHGWSNRELERSNT